MDIYYLPLNCNSWCNEDNYLMNFLTPERKAKIHKYINVSDKRLSLYAALMTRMILSEKTCCSSDSLRFVTEDNHKPQLMLTSHHSSPL